MRQAAWAPKPYADGQRLAKAQRAPRRALVTNGRSDPVRVVRVVGRILDRPLDRGVPGSVLQVEQPVAGPTRRSRPRAPARYLARPTNLLELMFHISKLPNISRTWASPISC